MGLCGKSCDSPLGVEKISYVAEPFSSVAIISNVSKILKVEAALFAYLCFPWTAKQSVFIALCSSQSAGVFLKIAHFV